MGSKRLLRNSMQTKFQLMQIAYDLPVQAVLDQQGN